MNGPASDIPRPHRRSLLKAAGAGAVIAGAAPLAACGGSAVGGGGSSGGKSLKIGFVSPVTGQAASFGEPDPYIVGLARKALKDGLKIGGTTYAVEIITKDGQSTPQRGAQVANDLINSSAVDLVLTTSTPETVNPVSDAAEAAGVPCLSTVVPWEAWYFGRGAKPGQPSPFKFTYHFCFGTAEFAKAYLSLWNGPVKTNKRVGVMWPNDADGNAIRENLGPALKKGGFTIVDPGAYADGTNDYSAQIARFKAADCEIFNTFPLPPDFATFWRQAAQQGYVPKIAQIAKTGLFPSQVEALGALGRNLATAAFWSPTYPYRSPLTGLTSKQLADGYEQSAGKQWNQVLGTTMALFDAGVQALKDSGDPKDRRAVAAAMGKLKVDTNIGHLDWTKGPVPNVVSTPIIGSQWVPAAAGSRFPLDLNVVENATDRNVPIAAMLKPYR